MKLKLNLYNFSFRQLKNRRNGLRNKLKAIEKVRSRLVKELGDTDVEIERRKVEGIGLDGIK